MVRWIDTLSEWDGSLPATFVAITPSPEQRENLPRALAARALASPPGDVEVRHPEGRPPLIARPAGSGLHLSKASRGAVMAVSVAASPVGVDVEQVDADGEIPWNVLHSAEAAMLLAHDGPARARAFARLWSLKEAYAKALGVGLSREPSSYEVQFAGDEHATVRDPLAAHDLAEATTVWRAAGGAFAISTVILALRPRQAQDDP
jgi:phosphopantetheinyl transferase